MKKNIIWIIIDGVRNYPCPTDPEKMGKPALLDEIAEEGVEFQNVVTSATSTVMSVSAMMLSIPAYYLSRNLGDFRLDKSYFESFSSILEDNGYTSYSVTVSYEMRRDSWEHILRPVDEKYWPKGCKRMMHWNNEPLNPIAFNLLDEGAQEPFFLFMHYNGRRDGIVAERAGEFLDRLKEEGLYDDSILVLCSDHGMPDASRVDVFQWLTERGLYYNRHDLIMTDDNIMVPLVIRYPGCLAGKKVGPAVGTIDIVPTLLDLVGIPFGPGEKYGRSFRGKNLVALIDGGDVAYYRARKFRTDTRYIAQHDRIISTRGSDFKYVYFRDIPGEENQQFFDLEKDPLEENNLIGTDDSFYNGKIAEYKAEFERLERDAIEFQKEYLVGKFCVNMSRFGLDAVGGKPKILLFGTCHGSFLDLAYEGISSYWSGATVDYIVEPPVMPKTLTADFRTTVVYDRERFDHRRRQFLRYIEEYDYVVVPISDYLRDLEQSRSKSTEGKMQSIQLQKPMNNQILKDYKKVFKMAKRIRSNGVIYIDYNMDVYRHPHWMLVSRYLAKVLARRDIYLHKPFELFRDAKRFITKSPKPGVG